MKKKKKSPGTKKTRTQELRELQKRAEARLRKLTKEKKIISTKDVDTLVEKLHTYQVELEMQNEELRITQEDLTESRDRFSDLYDFAPTGYITIDKKGFIQESNLTFSEMVGIDRVRLLKKPLSKFVFSDDQDTYYIFLRGLSTARKTKSCVLRLRQKNSEPFWVSITGLVVKDKSVFRLTLTDIAEREKIEKELEASEQRFRQVAENTNEWMWEVDTNGLYTYSSNSVFDILGYRPKEIVGKKHFYDFFSKDVKQDLKKIAFESFAKKQSFRKLINPNIHKKGHEVVLETSGSPVLDRSGKLLGYRGADTDISKQVRTNEHLLNEKRQLELISTSSLDMIFSMTKTGVFKFVSPASKKVIGYEPREMIGKTFGRHVPKREWTHCWEGIRDVFLHGQIVNFETIVLHRNGKEIPIEINAQLVKTDGGSIVYATMRDITERKKAEEEIVKSKEHLGYLISATPAIIYTCKASGNYAATFIGENIFDRFGYTSKEFLSTPGFWRDHIHPDDKKRVFSGLKSLFKKSFHIHDYRFLHKDGNYRWVLDELQLTRDETGKPVEILGSIIDITERKIIEDTVKSSEEKYRELVTEITDGVFSADRKGRFRFINAALSKMYGAKNPDEMVGMSIFDIIVPDEIKRISKEYLRAFRTKKSARFLEVQCRTKKGDLLYVEVRPTLIFKKGIPVGTRGIIVDITERKKAEEEIKSSKDFLDTVMDNSPFAMWIADDKGTIIRTNKSLCKTLGLSDKQIVGKYNVLKDINLTDQGVMPMVRNVFKKKMPVRFNIPWTGKKAGKVDFKGASDLHIDVSMFPILDGKGKLQNVVCQWIDVTEQKKAEGQIKIGIDIANTFLLTSDEDTYDDVLNIILDVTDSKFGVFGYIDDNGDFVVPSMTRHIWKKCQVPNKEIRFPKEKWGCSSWPRAIREKKANFSNVPSKDIPRGHIAISRHISLPIVYNNQVIGLFQVANKQTDYTENDIRRLKVIADQVAPLLDARLERKRAEEKLKKAQQKYRELYESSQDAIMILEPPTWNFTAGNKATVKMFRAKTEKEFTSKKPYELSPKFQSDGKPSMDKAIKMINLAMKKGSNFFEWQHKRINGEEFPATVLLTRMELEGKKVLQATVRDITEHKRAEDLLKESEDRLKIAGGLSYDLIYEWDVASDSLEWFGNIDKLLGYKKGVISRNIDAWINLIHPDDREQLEGAVELHRTSTKPINYNYRVRHKDGTYRYWTDHAHPLLDHNGRPYKWIGVCADITERKIAEAELHNLAKFPSENPNLVLRLNSKGKVIYKNEAVDKLLKQLKLTQKNISKILPHNLQKLIHEALKVGRPVSNIETEFKHIVYSYNLSPIKKGEYVNLYGTDITERKNSELAIVTATEEAKKKAIELKKAYEGLQRAQSMLLHSEKMAAVGQLAAGVAHEVKNPLQIIIQGLNYLERTVDFSKKEQAEVLNVVKDAIQRSDRIVHELLNFTRVCPMEFEYHDINKILKSSLNLVEKQLTLGSIKVTENYSCKTPIIIDKSQIEQVFINIILNAAHAMPKGGSLKLKTYSQKISDMKGDIKKSLLDKFQPTESVLICEIEDTGKGIPKSDLGKIFEPFYSTKTSGGGMGIGLSVTKSIMERHRGLIKMESQEGVGTTARVILPLSKGGKK